MGYRNLAVTILSGVFLVIFISGLALAQEGVAVGRRDEVIRIKQEIRRHREAIKDLIGQLRQLGVEYREEKKERIENMREKKMERREDLRERRKERREDLRGRREAPKGKIEKKGP